MPSSCIATTFTDQLILYMRNLKAFLQRLPQINANALIALSTLFIVTFNNRTFWRQLFGVIDTSSQSHTLFIVAVSALQFTLLYVFLSLFAWHRWLKPLLALALVSSAALGYFMDAFGTVVDTHMIQNAMETDSAEALDLLSPSMIGHLFIYGMLPGLLVLLMPIKQQRWNRSLAQRLVLLSVTLSITATLSYFSYRDISFIFRENRAITFMINPLYPLRSAIKYVRDQHTRPAEFQVVFDDAHRNPMLANEQRHSLFVMVLGETARADNFHLNGYSRETTPELEQHQVLNFRNTSSCGTATAISVPCIFSVLDHDNYDDGTARNSENLMDALKRAGIETLWRENNSGCKGVCARTPTQTMVELNPQDFCNEDGCFDEALLFRLQDFIDKLDHDAVIVLHQQGSHGPAYFKRYPQQFARFQPACDQADVQNCSYQEVVNAYDNSILYTDHVLGRVIDLLKANSQRFDTAMLYVSDHGESLGENGVFLHGLPYLIAPEQQTHVPFMMWLSKPFMASRQLDEQCLSRQQQANWSHDNILHSMLGASGVLTRQYDPALDIFSACRNPSTNRIAGQPGASEARADQLL